MPTGWPQTVPTGRPVSGLMGRPVSGLTGRPVSVPTGRPVKGAPIDWPVSRPIRPPTGRPTRTAGIEKGYGELLSKGRRGIHTSLSAFWAGSQSWGEMLPRPGRWGARPDGNRACAGTRRGLARGTIARCIRTSCGDPSPTSHLPSCKTNALVTKKFPGEGRGR